MLKAENNEKQSIENVRDFLFEICDLKTQKKLLESVSSVQMDGMPKGSAREADARQMRYEYICETLRVVNLTLSEMSSTERVIIRDVIDRRSDSEIVAQIGYSLSYYYHTMKKSALLHFAKLYPLAMF
ncbi:ArpU family phage packaging/lysis transcriptional regulator [Limosilactobacillus reuteri]|uniref:hypothetical protein n=1 Tax=Limosilactobacillus reuteri TaxID=1598 RepID=UPI001E56DA62|nr:hypothetical protein [Limosilactobacillus reuteri]MCC4503181.1 hypothetical protein [Limosilactobacillus reuteri]